MAEDERPEADTPVETQPQIEELQAEGGRGILGRRWGRMSWGRRLLAVLLGLIALLGLCLAVLDSPVGHRFVADRLARLAPASGLRFEIGKIEGSLYGRARLQDVVLSDTQGVFARIPEARLDWRPFNWFTSGLDVRELVARNGTLLRLPQLNPGDPDAPLLPNFDIRVDRLEIDALTLEKPVLGTPQRVDLLAKVDLRDARQLLRIESETGGGDKLFALLDAAPPKDKFDLRLDYRAPKGGLLSALTGMDSDLRARIAGNGRWSYWDGAILIDRATTRMVALKLTNRSGHYGLQGLLRPDGLLSGTARKAVGDTVWVNGRGTLEDSLLDGRLAVGGAAFRAKAVGGVDLNGNAFDDLRLTVTLSDPALFGAGTRLEGTRLAATLDGPFRSLSARVNGEARRIAVSGIRAEKVALSGRLQHDGSDWRMPLELTAERIVTGDPALDRQLQKAEGSALLTLSGTQLRSDNVILDMPGLSARLALHGDLQRNGYEVSGTVTARGLALPSLGRTNARAKIDAGFGKAPWFLRAKVAGQMTRVDNGTLTTLAGTDIRYSAGVSMGGGRPLLVQQAEVDGSKLHLALTGRLEDGRTAVIEGDGRHADYGPFTVEAQLAGDGLHAALVLADPLPAAGLRDVRVALAPVSEGFRIEAQGGSGLGPFDGALLLYMQPQQSTRLAIEHFDLGETAITGEVVLEDDGMSGQLALAGGGLDGTVQLMPHSGGGQAFDAALRANDVRFAGATQVAIRRGRLTAKGFFAPERSTLEASFSGRGIGVGTSYIGRIRAKASLENGSGTVMVSLAGQRGNRFNLNLAGKIEPGRISMLTQGEFAGRAIDMPRWAVLTRQDDGGWQLARTQIDFGDGRLIASGVLGGDETRVDIALSDMPLSLIDTVGGDLALGGQASGLMEYRQPSSGLPTGHAKLMIKGLTRSGLVLTSRAVDLAVVAELSPDAFQARVAVKDGETRLGRVQARLANLPREGGIGERMLAGNLVAQLRYSGPADALWRLAAIEAFDMTGAVSVAADVTGTLRNPGIHGTVSADKLRMQSALTGTDITDMRVRGYFAGPLVQITSVSGKAVNGGKVSGAGTVDLSELFSKGAALDLRLAAQEARLLARPDMSATVTGPIRIVSDGATGTIAGRLNIEEASWRMGNAPAVVELPNISTRHINMRADAVSVSRREAVWRYLIDATGNNRIAVRGMGLDSEWSAKIRLRGTTAAPAIGGESNLVRGRYDFAGKSFDLSRGHIVFDGSSPPNPRLDIVAEGEASGVDAKITIGGTATKPDIAFSSTPALPEDELLSRILFGSSITDISATEALQLSAALASLRGGGGIDPINRLRRSIGLDQLRVVGPDVATGQETGIAAGKYLGDRFYAEVVTDGRGYSASNLEFRVTNWLSLLASVSTIGRQGASVEISKDY